MSTITVIAKVSAGFHPGLGVSIVEGEEYTIREDQFADQLFNPPTPGWIPPWERLDAAAQPDAEPSDDKQSGGKKK